MLPHILATLFLLPALQNPAPAPVPTPSKPEQGKVAWYAGRLEQALAEAKGSNKIVFVDFTASWCSWCMKMNREVFATDEAASALENVICVSVDYDKQREVADRYAVGKALPVTIWFNPDGTVRERIENFQSKAVFLANVARIKADIGTINEQRRKVETNGADLEARFVLYRRLIAVGDRDGAAAQRAAIEKADPQGNSRAMHHFKYEALTKDIENFWAQTKTLDPKRIEALRTFVEGEFDPELIWDGWMRLANTHKYYGEQAQARGESEEAKKNRSIQRDCLSRAWRGIPQDDETVHGWVLLYAGQFWDLREELSAGDKSFLLSMTEAAARRFEGEGLVHDLHARALFLSGKRDAALAACEKAIEVAKATNQDPQIYEQRLEWVKNGGK